LTTLETDQKETGRIEAFSDGVIAIAITLLVLDLKVPHVGESENLFSMLLKQWSQFVAFLNSFITILIIWINHHNLFNHIRRTNNLFMLFNGILLLTITFLPFPTSLVADYFGQASETTAAALYGGTFFVMSLAFNALWRYASYNHRLLHRNVTEEQVHTINKQYLIGPTFYGLSFLLAFVNVTASLALTVALALFYAVTASMSQRPQKGSS
jgi:uncharacterized membrane protein